LPSQPVCPACHEYLAGGGRAAVDMDGGHLKMMLLLLSSLWPICSIVAAGTQWANAGGGLEV
jgi:hypothetical protein